MQTIQAQVNPRLLTKANRLFTGTLQGRIIEILQNARRAGSTKVAITNQGDHVIVRDNGAGIEDFSKLLDLGGSAWEDSLEQSEDPAGVGLFCLAPKKVTIRSKGKMVTIDGDGWTGKPVTIRKDPKPVKGTLLRFKDEPWTSSDVDLNAVFCGMKVTVDGKRCPREVFVSDQAAAHPKLGCRIEVRESKDLNSWHTACKRPYEHCDNVLVNFHGQVVSLHYTPVSEHHLFFLIDMTGEPTGIRLMLPARTCLVENDAFKQLQAAMELEAYRYLKKRGHHRLPYKEYLRARDLGIKLPEAEPTYRVGLLSGDTPEPVEVVMPKDFPLASCYRFDCDHEGDETDEANVHLLAATGTFKEPFVPVDISRPYDGYSWAKLPTIGKVTCKVSKKLHESWIWSGKLLCTDSIVVTAHTSDGRVFSSPVCMTITPPQKKKDRWCCEEHVHVTPQAQQQLNPTDIWYHLGGWSDEGDSYDSQEYDFTQELDRFWDQLIGPDEHLRRQLIEMMGSLTKWRIVTLCADGTVAIQFEDGTKREIEPPTPAEPVG